MMDALCRDAKINSFGTIYRFVNDVPYDGCGVS